jgi:hypothetical protein
LRRAATITERTIITLNQVLRVVHCGYRCPVVECAGHKRLYRSSEADALALTGFTFGLDIVLVVGQLRLREHQTVDEIHQTLMQRLEAVGQTISRREILLLFEAYKEQNHDHSGEHTQFCTRHQAVVSYGRPIIHALGLRPRELPEC